MTALAPDLKNDHALLASLSNATFVVNPNAGESPCLMLADSTSYDECLSKHSTQEIVTWSEVLDEKGEVVAL